MSEPLGNDFLVQILGREFFEISSGLLRRRFINESQVLSRNLKIFASKSTFNWLLKCQSRIKLAILFIEFELIVI